MKINGKTLLFTGILVLAATFCKFFFGPVMTWSGFSPVIAIALFSGFIIRQKGLSFLLPLLALLVSDVVIQILYKLNAFDYAGFYSGQWKNYLLLLGCTVLGWIFKGKNYGTLSAGALAAPVIFFLGSNFLVWAGAQLVYSKDFTGLMACYAAGIPFFRNSLIATMVFLPGILLLYNYLIKRKAQLTLA